MFQVEWDQEDLNELNISLDGIMPKELMRENAPRLAHMVEYGAKGYPPPKQGSSYIRTNKLFEGWKREVKPMAVRIFNPVDYGIFVQGREQVAMHRATGWKRLHEIAEAQVERFIYFLEMRINKIWNTPFN